MLNKQAIGTVESSIFVVDLLCPTRAQLKEEHIKTDADILRDKIDPFAAYVTPNKSDETYTLLEAILPPQRVPAERQDLLAIYNVLSDPTVDCDVYDRVYKQFKRMPRSDDVIYKAITEHLKRRPK